MGFLLAVGRVLPHTWKVSHKLHRSEYLSEFVQNCVQLLLVSGYTIIKYHHLTFFSTKANIVGNILNDLGDVHKAALDVRCKHL